jgi:acylaminoacyl-peptidase
LACYRTPTWPSNPTLYLVGADGSGLRPVDPAFDRNSGVGASLDAREPARWLADGRLLSAAEDRGETALIAAREGGSTEWLGRAPRVLSGFSSDGTSVAFVASSATEPAEIFLIDGSGRERRLTDMNAAWRGEVALSQPEKFTLQTDDPSVDIDCWVMKPAGFREGRKYPVLLNIHGGPFTQYGEGLFDEFQVYAGAGYGVVYCNPRGSSGQDTPFGRAVIGDLGGPDYRDITAAFESALARMPWADEGRLGVMGGSYGGFMTTWVIGHTDRFAAAISERAVNDWYLMQGTSDIGGTFNPAYLGERATIHEDLDAVLRQSPITYAKDIRTPVLILHSEDDLRCPISQGEQLFVALKLLRRDVEFVRFPDENHELTRSGRPSHRIDRFDVVLDYWARKLGKASSARSRTKPARRRPR